MNIPKLSNNDLSKFMTERNNLVSKKEKSPVQMKKTAVDYFKYSNRDELAEMQPDGSRKYGGASFSKKGYENYRESAAFSYDDATRQKAETIIDEWKKQIAEIKTGNFELRTVDQSYTGDFYELSDEFKNQDNLAAWMKAKSQSIIKLGMGCANGVPSRENIAKYFGDMSKRLDEAYAEGRFTDEEYDKLNMRLNEYIEETISSAERTKAFYALGKERGSHVSAETLIKEQMQTPEEFRADLNSRITEYVEKVCKYDRDWIYKMINNIRYGAGALLK